MELPLDLVESETVALIYDEEDGLGFYAEFVWSRRPSPTRI